MKHLKCMIRSLRPISASFSTVSDGLLSVYKPRGLSSAKVVAKVKAVIEQEHRRQYGSKLRVKVGHGGTLDPMATGVLVLGIGKGCQRLTQYLSGSKEYRTVGILGDSRDTLDATGSVLEKQDWSHVTTSKLASVLTHFRGEIEQIPPMHSALKSNGRRLYEMAREGISVERKPRRISISKLELVQDRQSWEQLVVGDDPLFAGRITDSDLGTSDPFGGSIELTLPKFGLHIECGGGTYVRSLIADIASHDEVRSVAHMSWLERLRQGPFRTIDCLPANLWDFEKHPGPYP